METQLPELDIGALTPPLNVQLITSPDQLATVEDYLTSAEMFGYDIETNITDSFTTRKIRTIQLGDTDQQFVIDLLGFAGSEEAMLEPGFRKAPKWAEPIVDILQAPLMNGTKLKVGQNLAFEYETVLWNLGIRSYHLYDTMLAEKVVRCGEYPLYAKDTWGLKDIVARYFKRTLSKVEQKGFDLKTPLTEAQVVYGALDVRIPIAVMKMQQKIIEKRGLQRAVRIQSEAIPAFSEMKVNGMLLDRDAWTAIVDSNETLHRKNVAEMDRHFLPLYGTKHNPATELSAAYCDTLEAEWRGETDKELRKQKRSKYQEATRNYKAFLSDAPTWEGEAALNYGSDQQILGALQKYGAQYKEPFATIPATNEKILSKYADQPVIKAVLEYRKTQKTLSTYGRAFLDYIDPVTGRVHPNINLFGAETGRTTASKPNSQNIPPDQRKCFVARPGYVLITSDMSGAELRIIAELSDDPAWITAFENGWDVHSIGAEMMYGVKWHEAAEDGCEFDANRSKCHCKAHKAMRDSAKAINFGVAYGMEKYALAQRLKIDPKEADSLLRAWRDTNPTIHTYLQQSGLDAKQQKCAKTFSGFTRSFPEPNWERATVIAADRSVADGKGPLPSSAQINKVYQAMFGSMEREGKNTPIQGGNAVVAKVAMGSGFDRNGEPFMWHRLREYRAELINFVHDEFVVECPEETAKECQAMIRDCIRRAGAEFMTRVVMESESNIAVRWEK